MFLTLAFSAIFTTVSAEEELATGKLLIATEEVRGSDFARTVILLLHYDESGALGLVINRPIEATPKELLPELEGLKDYDSTAYWGGPVRMATMRALHRTDDPQDDEIQVFDSVHQMPLDEKIPQGATNQKSLRFFLGYAGWSPGQLDREILFGSWNIIPATEEAVFTEDPDKIWQELAPPRHYRASAGELLQRSIWVK